ncbi:MAG TPA: MGMT family protein [Acidimicrobiia bacterium]|nr:MGMT family protein [Acidimicrobiia bacterium]
MTRDFESAVLDVVRSIPAGQIASYGDVAAEAGFPRAARAVGTLLRSTTEDCPWWRVVGWDGRLRAPDTRQQARLLSHEGVIVRAGRAILGP